MKKLLANLSSAAMLLPLGAAQAMCINNATAPCQQIIVDMTGTKIACLLNMETESSASACMVDLDDVKTQVNNNSSVQANNISISDETPMVIQAWGGRGSNSVSSEGHSNVGGTGGYAQTSTSINAYNLNNFSTQLYFFVGAAGAQPSGSEQSHCGAGGGASTVVSALDLSLFSTRPILSEVIMIAGGGGGAGGFNASGLCEFGGGGSGGPGSAGGVAIAGTAQDVNAAGTTNQDSDLENCASDGGGDWDAKGGAGSGSGGAGVAGIGSWGGNGGGGSSCSPGATAKWLNADISLDSGGGGNTDTASCTAGGGGGGGGYGGGGGGRHGNSSTYSCGGGGGGSYAVSAASSGGPQSAAGNPFGANGGVVLQFLADSSGSPSPITVSQTVDASSYQQGDTVNVGLSVQNAQPASEFYMAALMPDGNTMYFVTHLSPLTLRQGFLNDPHSFRPLADRGVIPNLINASLPGLFTHLFSGAEPSGRYHFYSALTHPNAFGNGSIDDWDFLSWDVDSFILNATDGE